MSKRKPMAERFWSKVDVGGPDDCWPWAAAVNDTGYGAFMVACSGGVFSIASAHRVSLFLATGEWGNGLDTRHSCHNRLCVNPAHLSLGTRADNMRDAVGAHRTNRGEDRPQAKLTWTAVHEARKRHACGVSARALAQEHGVSERTMRQCLSGETWKVSGMNG